MKFKKSIFFLKTPKAVATASNSVNLRFKLASSGKYKVKGLGISCQTQDWDQEEQLIKESHSQFEKHNKQLNFIGDELALIEKERNVTDSDIDTIVEASIKECTVKDLDYSKKLLHTMVINFVNHMEKNGSFSQHYQRRMESVGKILLKFEKAVKYQIDATILEKSLMHTQEDIIEYFRDKKAKDSTTKAFLTNLNAAISHYNKYSENPIKTFNKRAERWVKEERQIVALTKEELKKLYDLVFNPTPSAILKPNPVELRNLKFFLFRCFCGMRVGDMHVGNINPNQLTRDSKTFTYRQGKVNKHATVTCINTYLFDIAESLEWKFPSEIRHKSINSYSYRETLHIRKYTGRLFAENMRQIEHNRNKDRSYTNLSEEISTHTPRKTYAHLLYNITNDIMRVKKELGHTKIETTMRYLDFLLDEETASLKTVDVFK